VRYIFGSVYLLVYLWLAISFVPVDNFSSWGTFIFLAPLPTFFVNFYVLHIVDRINVLYYKRLFVSLLIGHYLTTAILFGFVILPPQEMKMTVKMFYQYKGSFVATVSVYLVGQLIIWARFNVALDKHYPESQKRWR